MNVHLNNSQNFKLCISTKYFVENKTLIHPQPCYLIIIQNSAISRHNNSSVIHVAHLRENLDFRC